MSLIAEDLEHLYHATPTGNVPNIMRVGIGSRKIYLTPYQDDARSLAREMHERTYHKGTDRRYTLLEISLPPDTPIHEDPDVWGSDIAYYVRVAIPPKDIRIVHSFRV